jgi:hypothetical protein
LIIPFLKLRDLKYILVKIGIFWNFLTYTHSP